MSIARRAASYAALSTVLAVLATALVAAMPGAQAWAARNPAASPPAASNPKNRRPAKDGRRRRSGAGQAMLVRGRAIAPRNAPRAVRRVINSANRIRSKPYIWGGGHGRWWDRGYDCSGAVGYALHGGGLLETPMTSGSMEGWGKPGRAAGSRSSPTAATSTR